MQRKILVISHGNLAESIVRVAELILGKTDNLKYLGLKADESRESFVDRIEKYTQEDCEYIILADLMSGTPFNAAFLAKKSRKNLHLIAGYNLPLILTLLNDADVAVDDAIQDAIETGRQMIFQADPVENK